MKPGTGSEHIPSGEGNRRDRGQIEGSQDRKLHENHIREHVQMDLDPGRLSLNVAHHPLLFLRF